MFLFIDFPEVIQAKEAPKSFLNSIGDPDCWVDSVCSVYGFFYVGF